MQPRRKRSRFILGVLALGLLAGGALTAGPAQADSSIDPDVSSTGPLAVGPGPYYALPSWARKMGVVNRFVVLTDWSSAAVLDKETGLVWERTPELINLNFSWFDARSHCLARQTGNHKGWRLPSIHELASLLDPLRTNPALPAGHPFVIALPLNTSYWSATTNAAIDTQVWAVSLVNGVVGEDAFKAGSQARAWCVRGGMNAAAY